MELFDIPKHGESKMDTAVLVQMNFNSLSENRDEHEFKELVRSAGATDVAFIKGGRSTPDSRFFVGKGKAEEIHQVVKTAEPDVVIFDHDLSPAQERNLEKTLECRVMDRTGLILDIFAQRARSHEGKLQVELAQLRHMSTRLIRGWTHLERQKGGVGLRGPGETQLETDRRLLSERMVMIGKRLEKVERQRQQGRRSRTRAELPTISLVGYTNAGKSTLFNLLTASDVYAADQLFATLDPTLRRIELEGIGGVILADTVGFIRHLPHDLVAAFKATLTETREAELLIHVVDISDDRRSENIEQVEHVLSEIEADEVPQLIICNKIDNLDDVAPRIDRDYQGRPIRVWLSAQANIGIDLFFTALTERLGSQIVETMLVIPPTAGKLRGILYRLNSIQNEHYDDEGNCHLNLKLPKREWNRLVKQEGNDIEQYVQLKP